MFLLISKGSVSKYKLRKLTKGFLKASVFCSDFEYSDMKGGNTIVPLYFIGEIKFPNFTISFLTKR